MGLAQQDLSIVYNFIFKWRFLLLIIDYFRAKICYILICISVMPMIYWKRLIPTAKTHYLQIKLPFNMSISAKELEFYLALAIILTSCL